MRRRIRDDRQFEEPSLVPLADMLTNTVGILVFILVFTVLTAGAAVIAKRLPMEHESDRKDVTFICFKDRLYALKDSWIDEFQKPLGTVERSRSGFEAYAAKFNGHRLECDGLTLVGEGEVEEDFSSIRLDLTLRCEPKPDKGLTAGDLRKGRTSFHEALAKADREREFFMFWVKPDSIDVFLAARDLAAGTGYSTGWSPQQPGDQPIRCSLTGRGRGPKEQ